MAVCNSLNVDAPVTVQVPVGDSVTVTPDAADVSIVTPEIALTPSAAFTSIFASALATASASAILNVTLFKAT